MRYRSMEATRSGDLRSDDGGVRRPSPNNVGRRRGQRPSPNNRTEDGGVRRPSPNNRDDERRRGQETLAEQTGTRDGGVRRPRRTTGTRDGGVRRSSPNDSASRSYSSTVIR